MNTYPGPATVYTCAREFIGGRASPEFVSNFTIRAPQPNVGIVNVTTSTSDTYVGHSVKITVSAYNEYYAAQDCNVTVRANGIPIATLNIVALPPWQITSYQCVWFTDNCGEGYYTISAYAIPVPNETYLFDNNFIGGIGASRTECWDS